MNPILSTCADADGDGTFVIFVAFGWGWPSYSRLMIVL